MKPRTLFVTAILYLVVVLLTDKYYSFDKLSDVELVVGSIALLLGSVCTSIYGLKLED
jgi:hypothetical protein